MSPPHLQLAARYMRNYPRWGVQLRCFLALAAPLLFTGAHAAQDEGSQHVVMIGMASLVHPAARTSTEALLEALRARAERPVVVDDESLDAVETMGLDAVQEARERRRLAEKYSNPTVDLVVASGSVALDFVLRHRQAIWPGAAVVYFGVSDRRLSVEELAPDVGGVALNWDIAGTLALASRLQPQARRFVYVAGASPYDQVFEPIFDAAAAAFGPQFTTIKLIGLPLAELQQRLAELPPESIVLYAAQWRDATGERYMPADLVEPLSISSAAPLYALLSNHIDNGALGGAVADVVGHGGQAGSLIAEVLNAKAAGRPLPLRRVAASSTCLVHAQQLARWGIPANRVPEDCVLLEAPASWLAEHGAVLLGVCAVLLVAGLVIALRVQERKRMILERETAQQREETAHVARLAIVGEITASIVHEVTQPLGAILSNADAAEMLLDQGGYSAEQIREILCDIRRNNGRAHRVVSRLRTLLTRGEMHVQRLDLNELMASALVLIGSEAKRRHVLVREALDPTLPSVLGDSVHLQQVLLNLLVNALDALEAAPVQQRRLDVSTRRIDERAVAVTVRDSGPGIASIHLPHLFSSFFTTKRSGMGLGLSIAKTIIDAHHGTVTAMNDAAGGAVFEITLPVAAVQGAHPQLASHAG